jgi:hypothetical protein
VKPSLPFSQPLPGIQEEDLGIAVGFSFPGELQQPTDQVALKVAALREIVPNPDGLTLVGIVEVRGAGQFDPGVYQVSIDLNTSEPSVAGLLSPIAGTEPQPIQFRRTPQILNPERFDSAYEEFTTLEEPPDTAVAISADSLCFVIKTEAPLTVQTQEPVYVRFCTEPGSPLSVRTTFADQYNQLEQLVDQTAERLEMQDVVQADQAISEMEYSENLENCAAGIQQSAPNTPAGEPILTVSPIAETAAVSPAVQLSPTVETPTAETPTQESPIPGSTESVGGACSSDITVAPVTRAYFDEQLETQSPPATGTTRLFSFASFSMSAFQAQRFSVDVAVVRVHKEIVTSLGSVAPGEYKLQYWYQGKNAAGQDIFYAATITGFKLNPQGNRIGDVVNQPVPAVPSTFVDDPNTTVVEPEATAQISACRIFRRCTFFQRTCT